MTHPTIDVKTGTEYKKGIKTHVKKTGQKIGTKSDRHICLSNYYAGIGSVTITKGRKGEFLTEPTLGFIKITRGD